MAQTTENSVKSRRFLGKRLLEITVIGWSLSQIDGLGKGRTL